MLPPSLDCLHNFGLWTMYYRRMCAPWDTKHRDGTYSSQPYIHFTEAIGAPFPRSSGRNCINSGMGCTIELQTSPEAEDYRSHSLSRICSRRRGSKVLRTMGPSLSIRSLARFNGIRAIHDRTKNSTRQLHESIVIEWMCKCECQTHRESALLKINFKMLKLKIP
jgi:hypothetical protein